MFNNRKIVQLIPTLIILLFLNVHCHQKTSEKVANEEEKFNMFLDSLNTNEVNAFEKLNGIRKYLAERIDLGNSRDSLASKYFLVPWEDISPFDCLRLFQQDQLTAQCGFTSYILTKLYNYAGHEAYMYKCGFDEEMTRHQFVLVRLDDKLVVQDAFYDITVVDGDGNPKDFFEILSEVKAGELRDIKIVQENVKSELWLDSVAELKSILCNEAYGDLLPNQIKSMLMQDDRLKIILNRNYDAFTKPSLEKMKPLLVKEGLPENYLSIYLKPLQIKDDSGSEEDSLKRRIEHLLDPDPTISTN